MTIASHLRRTVSDRRKVLAAVLALTVATIAIVEVVTVAAVRHQLMSRTDATLRSDLQAATTAVNVLSPQALEALNRIQQPLTGGAATLALDRSGHVISQVPSGTHAVPNLPPVATLRAELGRPFTVTGSNGVRRFRALAGDLGNGKTIVFATPLTDVDGTVNDLTHVALIVGGIAVALLVLLLWRLLAAAARPIDSMIDVATRIGEGDFSARIDPDDVPGDAARLAAALNQMVARIEAAFTETSASEARLRRFVADASHELRTPLTSIRGYAQLCRMGAAGDEAENAIVRIDKEAKRMSVLVDDLLLLARLDQGRPQSRELVDIASVAREVAEEAKMLEPDRRFELSIPRAPVFVLGDENELRRVFTNLVGNVRMHTSAEAACSLAVDRVFDTVTVTVDDRGPGMDADDAARAFDRFARADASRSRDSGGSGLGLAIVKSVVEAHGGEIDLHTALGEGTTLTVRLPAAINDAAPVTTSATR